MAKEQKDQDQAPKRAWRYSLDCPKGRIFKGADAIAAADKDGWVDSPVKLAELRAIEAEKRQAAQSGGEGDSDGPRAPAKKKSAPPPPPKKAAKQKQAASGSNNQ